MTNRNILDGPATAISISEITTSTPLYIYDGGGSITVDGQVGVSQVGTWVMDIVQKTVLTAVGTAAASGDNTLIAAPAAGNQLCIVAFKIQNETAVSTTAILKTSSASLWRHLGVSQTNYTEVILPIGRDLKIGDAKALILNLSGANSHGYSVIYYVEPV